MAHGPTPHPRARLPATARTRHSLTLSRQSLLAKKKKTGGGSLLVVLLETHLAAWAATATPDPATGDPGLDPAALVSQLGAFVGAHEMDDPANTAAVLGVHGGQW